MNKIYGYARVSSTDQNADRQIKALIEFGIDERDIIVDKLSGKDLNRAGYIMLRDTLLRRGDTLVITSIDRLSRNKQHIKMELEQFARKGIRVKILDLPSTLVDLPDSQAWVMEMVNNILLEVLSSIAEQERITIRKRQREGIDTAKAKGKHLGRPKLIPPDNWEIVYFKWKRAEISAKKAMEELHMKRTSFYKMIKIYENRI